MASADMARRRLPSDSPGRTSCCWLYRYHHSFQMWLHTGGECTRTHIIPSHWMGIPLIAWVCAGVWPLLADADSFHLKSANLTENPAVLAEQPISWRCHWTFEFIQEVMVLTQSSQKTLGNPCWLLEYRCSSIQELYFGVLELHINTLPLL